MVCTWPIPSGQRSAATEGTASEATCCAVIGGLWSFFLQNRVEILSEQ
ncbi:MAG: hypothetical protein ACI89J_002269 [Hyphomicrobiaceae bacterium]|jgi:hypothetical protein